ncbi:penicillin-binding protein [Demequina sp. B12]|uniref:transglycosylase domain-containing protein n=1 Tax=Demequina sp. B12 TaxID=2992757 RepID=UPI00237AA535|nr:transglycosylase domain-containing protein [Demequina sp. B12]MDE0572150.1 penicillin-binding protein [Demequina sp. B12]
MTNSSNTPPRRSTRVPTGAQPTRPATGVQRGASGKPANGIPPWGATGAQPINQSATKNGAAPARKTGPAGGSGGGKGGNGNGGDEEKEPLGWKGWLKRIALWLLIALLSITIIGIVALIIVYSRIEIPEPDDFAQAQSSVFYYADGETEMARLGVADRESVELKSLPEYVPQAFVAAEDRTFYTNPGINVLGMTKALWDTIVLDQPRGGSSITQQYVERYYVGETTTSIPGKIKETLLALKIDSEQTKDEVLENYLNTIYLGRGAYGVEAASREFFDKHAADLTIEEAAMLAAIVPAPSAWDPAVDPEKAESRWNYVLDGMVDTKFLTQTERDAITTFPETIEYSREDVFGGTQGYIVQEALNEVAEVSGISREEIESQGYRIVTTIIPEHQQAAEDAVAEMPDDHADNLQVAAVTVEADTGAITSMYGGSDYLERQRNAVTQDVAQAGSTFKPFALVGGLELGIGLDSEYLGNNEMEFDGFESPVRNFGGYDFGVVDLVEATEKSINTAYVGLAEDIGAQTVMDTAIRAGLPEDTLGLEANASNVLGTASPHALDMASAYATFATGGVSTDPYLVASLTAHDGEEVYAHEDTSRRVFEEDVMADTTYAMQQVIESGSGVTAKELGRPLAGKTGTSNDNRSAWFVAFSPQIVGAVAMYQVGEDGSTEQITPFGGYSEITGSTVPASIWTWMMGPILEDYPIEEFPERANVGTGHTMEPTTSPTPTESPSPSPTPTPSETETTEPPEPEPTETETTEPPKPQPSETTDPPDPQPSETTDPPDPQPSSDPAVSGEPVTPVLP